MNKPKLKELEDEEGAPADQGETGQEGGEDELGHDPDEGQEDGDEEGGGEEEQPDEVEGDDSDLLITIGDEGDEDTIDPALEAELGGKGKAALAALRASQKEASRAARASAREAKEAKEALEALQRQLSPPKDLPLPTLEECGFNDAVYAQKMEAYVVAKAAKKSEEDAATLRQQKVKEDYDQRLVVYKTSKTTLKVPDFEEAEDTVVSTLSTEQQSMIIRCVDNPAKVVYALGKSKKALQELAAIKDWDRFAYRLSKIEGEIKVNPRKPPPPETRLKAGGSPGSGGTLAAQLAAAEKRAEASGDRTEVIRIKQQMKAAQK